MDASVTRTRSVKIFFLLIGAALLANTGDAQSNANSISAMRSWALKSGTNLVCRVTGFTDDSKAALIVLTNGVKASLPFSVLADADAKTLRLMAQESDLLKKGYIKINVAKIKAYKADWKSFQGFWMDCAFAEVESPDTGTAENYVTFGTADEASDYYFHFLAPKADRSYESPDLPAGWTQGHSDHKMDNRVMQLKRGDKIRLIGTYWLGRGLVIDEIVSLPPN